MNPNISHIDNDLLPPNNFKNLLNSNCNLKIYPEVLHRDTESMIYNPIITKNRQYLRPQKNSITNFIIFHQSIRGITHKREELLFSLSEINPQVLCITEHHLRPEKINLINLGQYTVGAHYCRRHFRQDGVAIFTLNNIVFDVIDLNQFCRGKRL